MACRLLDHVQHHPAKICDRLVGPVEPMLTQWSCVEVLRLEYLVGDLALAAVLLYHCRAGVLRGEGCPRVVRRIREAVVPCQLRLGPEGDPLEPHCFG